jgi:hypothetical protein
MEIKKLLGVQYSLSKENENLKKQINEKASLDVNQKEKELESKYQSEINSLKKKNKEYEMKISNLEKGKELEGKNKKEEEKEKEEAKDIYDNLIKDYEELKEQFEKLRESKSEELEKINNKLILDLKKKEQQNIKENEKKEAKINEQNLKIKELEEQIIILNEKISNITKSKSELEEIILKQEDNIIELNNTINNDYLVIQGHISEINKHEVYINQLLTTIKEQKIQIQNVKELQLKKDKEELIRLKTENKKFKSIIEVQNEEMKNNQKAHKALQEKYLQLCFDKRLKNHIELIEQAKEMKIRKMERDKKNSVFVIRKEEIEKNPNLSNKLNLSAKVNKTRNTISTPRNLKLNTSDDNKLPPINSARHFHQLSNFSHTDVNTIENDEE